MITQELLTDALSYGKCFIPFGKTAEYIPELSRVSKYYLGICVSKLDGTILKAGDTDVPFTIQSISKVVSLILAIEDRGSDSIFYSKVGTEPTGDPFHSIRNLETLAKPSNPFINAGAITVASCISGKDSETKFCRFLHFLQKLCNNPRLTLNRSVYESEKSTGNRNRSLAYYLKASRILEGNVEECLDFYFKMCSVNVTALDIARLSAVLANGGVSPFTGNTLIRPETSRTVRALMLTCGMYDEAGSFAVKVGFPAKSGVGGGIAVPIAGHMGIGLFGPALDEKGNSLGGIKILEYLSSKMGITLF